MKSLCFHIFLNNGAPLINPVNVAITALALFFLWTEGRASPPLSGFPQQFNDKSSKRKNKL
jgi:hypothetical protein